MRAAQGRDNKRGCRLGRGYTQSFNRCLLSSCYVPGTPLSIWGYKDELNRIPGGERYIENTISHGQALPEGGTGPAEAEGRVSSRKRLWRRPLIHPRRRGHVAHLEGVSFTQITGQGGPGVEIVQERKNTGLNQGRGHPGEEAFNSTRSPRWGLTVIRGRGRGPGPQGHSPSGRERGSRVSGQSDAGGP